MKNIFLFGMLVSLAGCSTVTINPKNHARYITPPTYKESLSFFLGGVVGRKDVDVKAICGNRSVQQVQTQATFLDSFLGIITLSIYSPETVKVWCEEKGAST